ncbi:MAG: hypothetical protein FWC99_06115 [Coriobacteriia bacterium]|nr:hypothetical protein [Coriobacteriia bacterium]
MTASSNISNKFSKLRLFGRKRLVSIALAALLLAAPVLATASPAAEEFAAVQSQRDNVTINTSEDAERFSEGLRGNPFDPHSLIEELTSSQRALLEQMTEAATSSEESAESAAAVPSSGVGIAPFSFSVGTEQQLRDAIAANEPVIELTASFTMTGASFSVPSGFDIEITSDTNGPHTITRTLGGRHFTVQGNLTLSDIIISGDHENVAANHGGIIVSGSTPGGRLTLDDGAIIQDNRAASGGGVELPSSAGNNTLIMNAGSYITNNRAASEGGGISIRTGLNATGINPPVTINPGAIISYNQVGTTPAAGNGGGGIFSSASSLIMNGGSIINNTSFRSGGGIVFTGQTNGPGGLHQQHFTMNDGLIDGNVTHSPSVGGGGISIRTGSESIQVHYNFLGGIISNNRDYVDSWRNTGGGIEIGGANARVIIANTITGNRAVNGDGGGISITGPDGGNNNVYIMPGAEISHNFAHFDGGGVYITPSNNLRSDLQGVSANSQNTLTMYGGTIANNYTRTGRFGGGVFLEALRWNLPANIATPAGLPAGFHWNGAHMDFHGGEIKDNGFVTDSSSGEITEMTRDGGGVYVRHASSFNATGQYPSSITGNRVTGDGGGVFTEAFEYEPVLVECQHVKLANGQVANPNPRIYADCEEFPYHNLAINEEVVFASNFAGEGGFLNPDNPEDTDIEFPLSGPSVLVTAGQLHSLNNYDINYRRPPLAMLVKTLHVPEGTTIPSASFDFSFTPVQVDLGGSPAVNSRPVADFNTLLAPNPQNVALDLSTATTATPTPAGTVAVTGTLNLVDLFEGLEPFPLPAGVFVWNVSEVDGSSNTLPPSQMTYDLDTHFQVRVHTDDTGQVSEVQVFELNETSGNFVVGSEVGSSIMNFLNEYSRNFVVPTGLAITGGPLVYIAIGAILLLSVYFISRRRKIVEKSSGQTNTDLVAAGNRAASGVASKVSKAIRVRINQW